MYHYRYRRTLCGKFTLSDGRKLEVFYTVGYDPATFDYPEEYSEPEVPDRILLDGCEVDESELPRGLAAVIPNLDLRVC